MLTEANKNPRVSRGLEKESVSLACSVRESTAARADATDSSGVGEPTSHGLEVLIAEHCHPAGRDITTVVFGNCFNGLDVNRLLELTLEVDVAFGLGKEALELFL